MVAGYALIFATTLLREVDAIKALDETTESEISAWTKANEATIATILVDPVAVMNAPALLRWSTLGLNCRRMSRRAETAAAR